MTDLAYLATQVAASERTLRRCVTGGLIRARRLAPRRLVVSPREQRYVRRYWPLLSRLRELLRRERNVRLAVLYGSFARGTDGPGSDIDVLVSLRDPSIGRLADIAGRLSEHLGRDVQLVRLGDAEHSPPLLADVLQEGRVLVDRDGEWPRLRSAQPRVRRRAEAADRRLRDRAREALESMRATYGG